MTSSSTRRVSHVHACALEMTVEFETEEDRAVSRRSPFRILKSNISQLSSSDDCPSMPRSSPISPMSSSGPICRICHEGDVKEELASPCRCAGSMQMVHRTCLEKWLSSSNSDACEICKYKFTIYRQPKSFSQWMKQQSHPDDYRNLMGDLLCFIVLTPLATISSYLCFIGAKHYSQWSSRWEASGLVCLSILLLSIYVAWCIVTARYHHRVWSVWRIENQNVHLIQMRHLSSPELDNSSNRSFHSGGDGARGSPRVVVEMTVIASTSSSHVAGTSRRDLASRRATTYLANRHRFGESVSFPFLVEQFFLSDDDDQATDN